MRIDRVAYEALISFGDYRNASVRAEAALADDEQPSAALEALRAWVGTELARVKQEASVTAERAEHAWRLDAELQQKQAEVERLTKQAKAIKTLLERHGVDVSEYDWLTDLPF